MPFVILNCKYHRSYTQPRARGQRLRRPPLQPPSDPSFFPCCFFLSLSSNSSPFFFPAPHIPPLLLPTSLFLSLSHSSHVIGSDELCNCSTNLCRSIDAFAT